MEHKQSGQQWGVERGFNRVGQVDLERERRKSDDDLAVGPHGLALADEHQLGWKQLGGRVEQFGDGYQPDCLADKCHQ